MTSPRSIAITPEAAALDAQTRANMQGAEFVELRSHIREPVMSEYRAQQAQIQPVSFSE
jgi:hypothetical protein